MISEKIINSFIEQIPSLKNADKTSWSATRDFFEARLQSYNNKSQNWMLGAIIGEIGFNTFDHNYNFLPNTPKGLFCNFEYNQKYIALLDFGIGLKKSLERVDKFVVDDISAIETAFTKQISGRAPENRGNGLKFVLSSVINSKYNLYYQSGNAICQIDGNGYSFGISKYNHNGCFCIVSSEGENDC